MVETKEIIKCLRPSPMGIIYCIYQMTAHDRHFLGDSHDHNAHNGKKLFCLMLFNHEYVPTTTFASVELLNEMGGLQSEQSAWKLLP